MLTSAKIDAWFKKKYYLGRMYVRTKAYRELDILYKKLLTRHIVFVVFTDQHMRSTYIIRNKNKVE